MSFSTVQWHFYCGYTILGLLIFRYLWGFVGPAPVRYQAFLASQPEIRAYLKTVGRRSPSGTGGHNPLGALSAITMILLLTFQAVSGLFVVSEDFSESGPLAHLVSDAASDRLIWWHRLVSKFLLAIVGLHVAAMLYYLFWKKENLILPMITGWKWVKPAPDSREHSRSGQ
jgi:cytochrome b